MREDQTSKPLRPSLPEIDTMVEPKLADEGKQATVFLGGSPSLVEEKTKAELGGGLS